MVARLQLLGQQGLLELGIQFLALLLQHLHALAHVMVFKMGSGLRVLELLGLISEVDSLVVGQVLPLLVHVLGVDVVLLAVGEALLVAHVVEVLRVVVLKEKILAQVHGHYRIS